MSHPNSLSISQTAAAKAGARARPRRFRTFRFVLLILVLALLSLLHPDCFRFGVRQFIRFEAWRNGVDAQLGSIRGSLFEPVVLRNSVWSYAGESGPVTRFQIDTATATFSWRNLLPRSSGQWFQRLTLEGVTGKTRLPTAAEPGARPPGLSLPIPRPRGRWLAAPQRFEAVDVDFIVESDGHYARFLQTALTLSKVETGAITAGQIVIRQPWLTRTFRNVTGTTALPDRRLQVADLTLEPGVEVLDFSIALDDFAKGALKIAVELSAFGGKLRAEVETLPEEPQFSIYVAAPFSQIDVAKLAAFLGVSDAAGGTIKAGRFTFRGPPQQFAKASAELRFEAAHFQWETRQWDSLVLGAKLLNGRIQVPELALAQGHNRLKLSGDMALPMPGTAWWRSEFSCDIAATIDNLTELSALMLPEFHYAAGRATIDGSVRGKDQQFYGRINVTGSGLRWHDAPIEKLAASVKLNGNQYQITDVSLFNGADYINGSGVVNIVGDKHYWGELRASVADLGQYSAILRKPIVPEPLAGGARIEWSGEGSAKAHTGKFLARLRKVRSLGATAARLHPINADFEATYSEGGMVFSKFALSDDESSFTAQVGVVNKAVSLQGIRLMQRQMLRLEGDALLPLDIWNAWPNTSLATLLSDDTVSKLSLTAYDLNLHETAQLTGLVFPIAGIVRGNVSGEGPLRALKARGRLTLSAGRLPLGWSGVALTGVEGAVVFDDQKLHVEKLVGRHPSGDLTASGEIDLRNVRDPSLSLSVTSAKSAVRLFSTGEGKAGFKVDSALALQVTGPFSGSLVSGDASIMAVSASGFDRACWDRWLVGELACEVPPVLTLKDGPWSAWRFDVHGTASNVSLLGEAMSADVRLTGTAADPALVGSVKTTPISGGGGASHSTREPLSIRQVAVDFRNGFPRNPLVTVEALGAVAGESFSVAVTGTMQDPMRVFACHPPLTEKAIRQAVNGATAARYLSDESRFCLLVPAEFRDGVELAEWPEISAGPTVPAAEDPPAPTGGAPL